MVATNLIALTHVLIVIVTSCHLAMIGTEQDAATARQHEANERAADIRVAQLMLLQADNPREGAFVGWIKERYGEQ